MMLIQQKNEARLRDFVLGICTVLILLIPDQEHILIS